MSRVDCSVKDWRERIKKGESILPPTSQIAGWNEEMADAGWDLYSSFALTELRDVWDEDLIDEETGERGCYRPPTAGEASPPWVREFVRWWFGCMDPKTGDRSVPEGLVCVSKKNAKSSALGLLLLAQLLLTKRRSALAVIVAPTKDAARSAYDVIAGAVEKTPGLNDMFRTVEGHLLVADHLGSGRNRRLKVISDGLDAVGGTKAQYILLDELHILGAKAKSRHMIQHLRGARAGRPDASMLICSTHAHTMASPIWETELDVFQKVRDGKLDLPRVYLGYEWPEDMLEDGSYDEPTNWHITNPSMGTIIDLDTMKTERAAEEAKGVQELAEWRNQFTNLPPDINKGANAWPGGEHWDECVDPDLNDPTVSGLDSLLDRSDVVVVAIDGGGLFDLLSLTVLGRESGTRKWLAWGHSWAHTSLDEKRPELYTILTGFADKGELTFVDYADPTKSKALRLEQMADVVSYVARSGKLYRKDSVGLDRLGTVGLAEAVMDEHLDPLIQERQVFQVPQSGALSPVITGLPNKIAQGEFAHDGSSLTRWAVSNAVMSPTGNAWALVKEDQSSKVKIDPLMSLIMAGFVLKRLIGVGSSGGVTDIG